MEAQVLSVIPPVELVASADMKSQTVQDALTQQELQLKRSLGVLARRAATAEYYTHLSKLRNSDPQTISSWEHERDGWNYKAANIIGRCLESYTYFHCTYSGVLSELINPSRTVDNSTLSS
jgi:hypothetical protein